GNRANFFECPFEELQTTQRYDAVLFCESFQYIKLAIAIEHATAVLRPGGYIVISDFFRTEAPGKRPLGGGPNLRHFYNHMAGQPFDCLEDLDITAATAPTLTLVNDCMTRAIRPIWEMTQTTLRQRHPWVFRLLRWTFRRQIETVEWKQLSGARN